MRLFGGLKGSFAFITFENRHIDTVEIQRFKNNIFGVCIVMRTGLENTHFYCK